MHTIKIIILFIVSTIGSNLSELLAQKSKKINQNTFSIDLAIGGTFSDYEHNQSIWRPKVSPAITLNLLGNHRLNNRIDLEYGVGGTFYYLINQGIVDKYILDFAAPHIAGGVGYNFYQRSNKELFVKLRGIVQIGYNGTFRDQFETYTVDISSLAKYHYFINFRAGWRTFLKRKARHKSQFSATEFGMNLRFAFQNLGDVTFTGDDYQTTISPQGDFAGFYYKIYFPVGGKKVKRKSSKEKEEVVPPPVIYSPRF